MTIVRKKNEEEETKGNGHKARITASEIAAFEEAETDKNIPGKGYLFHVKDKHLPETSRLNLREALSLAISDAQQEAINPDRTQSIFSIFRNRMLRYRISCGGEDWGEGRKESIILHQLSADEKAASGGGLYDQG